MSHLVPQARISRNLRLSAVSSPKPMRTRNIQARAAMTCDFYLRLPQASQASSASPPEYVQFARTICTERPSVAPALTDAAPAPNAPPLLATLVALQTVGLASAVGSVLGGHAASEAAKELNRDADVTDEIAFALPGAILGGLTGLAPAGSQLAILLPSVVHMG